MSDVAERIAERRDLLSPAERQVAEVVLRQPEGVAFGTVAEVAAVADTSGATVVRLATRLGYQGFSELQASVRVALGARPLRPAVERIRTAVGGDAGDDPVGATLVAELDNVRRTLAAIDGAAFARAVDLLASVDRVGGLPGRCGCWPATPRPASARCSATDLGILRDDVLAVHGSPAAVTRLLGPLGGGAAPVVVAIDLRRYERWVVAAAREAAAAGAVVIAVTDGPLSPLAAVAEVSFAVTAEGAGPFDSHTGTLALVNALVTGVAARLRESATTRVDALESRGGTPAHCWRADSRRHGRASGPGSPGGHVEGDDRAGRRVAAVLLVLGGQEPERRVALGPALDDAAGAVEPHPPQRRPVLGVVVDEQAGGGVRPQVVEPAEGERRLRLGVDRGDDDVAGEREAARHEVRPAGGRHGRQPRPPRAATRARIVAVSTPAP